MSTYSGASFFFSENLKQKRQRKSLCHRPGSRALVTRTRTVSGYHRAAVACQTSAVVQRRFKLARNTRPHVNGKRAKHSAHDLIAGSNNFTVFNFAAYASCIITNFTSAGPQMNDTSETHILRHPMQTPRPVVVRTCIILLATFSFGPISLAPRWDNSPGGYKVALGQLFTLYTTRPSTATALRTYTV